MSAYHRLADIQADLAAGKTTCVALAEGYLSRIKARPELNAFLEVFEEELLQQAATQDARRAEGQPLGRLHGLIIGLKDNIAYQGHRFSASSKILEGFESLFSATVTERLLAEDALIIGRLNCDEFAMGSSNENSAYGPVRHPLDTERVPGGSSGGSAAAVAANLCHAALGTDTGGSIRQPASLCGIYGLKPTYGRISRHGLIAYGSSFDQAGPMTRSLEDCALLLEVMAGPDQFDATAARKPVPAYSDYQPASGTMRFAVYEEVLQGGLEPELEAAFKAKIEALKEAGHTVDFVKFPYLDLLVPVYYLLATAEASSNLSRYTGVLYGKRSPEATDLRTTYTLSRSQGFGEEVKRRIMLGTFVLSEGYYDAFYGKAQKVRRVVRDETRKLLESYDAILSPTSPVAAFKLGEKSNDPIQLYLADIFTVQANIVGMPAITVPFANNSAGLPYGLQLMCGPWQEEKLFSLTAAIE